MNSANQIYTRSGVNGTWQYIEGSLMQISVGGEGRVWGVNTAN